VSGDEVSSSRRWATALRLAESDDPASEGVLRDLLDDPDEQIRVSAASSLIHRNPQLDAADLLRRLRSSSDGSPPTADEILRYHLSGLRSVDVVSPLIEALDSGARPDHRDLLFALAKTQQPAALEPLRARLHSEDAGTRREAAWLFGFLWPLGDGALRPLLAVVRTGSDAKQRANACSSLSNWFSTSHEAVEAVLEAALADSSRRVRREAGETLAGRRAVTRPCVEAAMQKAGTLRGRVRARLILRRMNLLDVQGWRAAIYNTTRVLRALPFAVTFLAIILRDVLRYRFRTRRHN